MSCCLWAVFLLCVFEQRLSAPGNISYDPVLWKLHEGCFVYSAVCCCEQALR